MLSHGGESLVTRELHRDGLAGGEGHDFIVGGREVQETVPPPGKTSELQCAHTRTTIEAARTIGRTGDSAADSPAPPYLLHR